ncbi:MAG: hypothetical protein EA400_10120 [Chromatiaceae bacterium]|nr:MAG: hypothetical protein EA400_10120 [Chromatiaceae bacterium]
MTTEITPGAFSHPDQPVRHSYPLAIEQASLATAIGLLRKTMPYALMRFGILLAVSIGTLIWLGATVGGGVWLGEFVHPFIGMGWLIGGFGLYGYIWYMVVRYGLYLIKAGHIAVLTELITRNQIDTGEKHMFAYGKDVVLARFKEVNMLFGLDLLIAGVIKAFNRTLDFVGRLLPVPGMQGLTQLVGLLLNAMTTHIDETLFSYNLARGDDNPWRSSRDGLVYYAQNAMDILKTAVWIVILEKILTVITWLLLLLPAFGVAYLMPGSQVAIWAFVIAALFAWNVKSAFLHPLFLIMIMTRFHVSVRGQPIDETWDTRLERISGKFAKIKAGIADWKPPRNPPAPLPADAPADRPAAS